MAQNSPIYEQTHKIPTVHQGSLSTIKDITIRIYRDLYQKLVIKLVEVDNHGFNYTCEMDEITYRQIKLEQSLEIAYDEFQTQLIDLLKELQLERMFLRLEVDQSKCKMIFYKKAKLKSLVLLTIDLNVTDQMEIIQEMSKNIVKLKEMNKTASYQITALRSELQEKERMLESALSTNVIFEKQFRKDLFTMENVFCSTLSKFEQKITDKLVFLSRRHLKLMNDLEIVKSENKLKCESNLRLVNSMQSLRLENERNIKLIDDLTVEVKHLNILRNNAEESCGNVRMQTARKDNEIAELRKQVDELKKDLQDATLIIAQKTKTHDELSKDLVQANTMLVNFNNQYDALSKEFDEAKEMIKRKDKFMKENAAQLARISEEFERYKAQYNTEELNKVKQELHFTKKNLQELEKQNKEAIKLNGLLTRKLSSGDATLGNNHRNANLLPPSQRNNY